MLLEQTEFQIRSVMEEAIEIISFSASKKNLELICDVDESVPFTVIGDPTRLRQIIVNLLSNAVKFSSTGSIVLSARSPVSEISWNYLFSIISSKNNTDLFRLVVNILSLLSNFL